MSHYLTVEYAKIFRAADFPDEERNANAVYLPAAAFAALRELTDSRSRDNIFRSGRRGGREYLQVQNYVGIAETPDGTVLEILPKIYFRGDGREQQVQVRRAFLRMLRTLPDLPFKQLGEAYLQAARFPLLEIFIAAFTEAVLTLLQGGLQQNYTLREANDPYLRGKLLFHKNIKQNLGKPYRFYTESDAFQQNVAPNRLLRTAVDFLLTRTRSYQNRNYLQQIKTVFADVPCSQNLSADLQKSEIENRLYPHYTAPLQWAKIFLQKQSYVHFAGENSGLSLLFPADRLFEGYVGRKFAHHAEDYQISLQDSRHHLLFTERGEGKFNLRPDITAEHEKEILLFDTKWKIIDPARPGYGIRQADLYQMLAYAEKYAQAGKTVKTALIYPQNSDFLQELSALRFYRERLPVRIGCWDFSIEEKENVLFLLGG